MSEKDAAAVSLGRRGGLARSEAKRQATAASLVKARAALKAIRQQAAAKKEQTS